MSIREIIAEVSQVEMAWLKKRDKIDQAYMNQPGDWAMNLVAQDAWHKRQAQVDRELSKRVRRIRMMI
ncbi:MAG: hypothetical protein M0R80_13465 [Proteobacteria bacterium]|jgi:hypothetical protein|nr:hypothetical protein [Pseudomonadota bacterium]